MTEVIKINPPYTPAILEALQKGMSYEMIDAASGHEQGWSKDFHERYMEICKQLQD